MSQAQQKYLFDQIARAKSVHRRHSDQIVQRAVPAPILLRKLNRAAAAYDAKKRKTHARLTRKLDAAYRIAHEAALFKPTAEALRALRKFEALKFK